MVSNELTLTFYEWCDCLGRVAKLNDYELTVTMLQRLIGMRDLIEHVKTVEQEYIEND